MVRKVIATSSVVEIVKMREADWDGNPLPVSWVQLLPSETIIVKSKSNGRIINLFLDSPFSADDIRIIQYKLKNGSKIFITKENGEVYFYEDTENTTENTEEKENNEKPPF